VSAPNTSAAAEALVNGARSYSDRSELVRRALRQRLQLEAGDGYCWVWPVDLTDTDVVYEVGDQLWQCGYTIADDGEVTLGAPVKVARSYVVVAAAEEDAVELSSAMESAQRGERDHLVGHVLEAKAATSSSGGRQFRVRIIAVGDSLNGNRYPEAVLAAAVGLYEGAQAFNRHRTPEELHSGTTEGLVGYYRNVVASAEGLDADLHLLPSATATAEALDAALAVQADGLSTGVGISHDVLGTFRAVTENGQSVREATAITHVFSADVVSAPAAGGMAHRVVAGGIHIDLASDQQKSRPLQPARAGETTEESRMSAPTPSPEALAAALAALSPEQLSAAGLQRTGESAAAAVPAQRATEAELSFPKTGFVARTMISAAVAEAGLPAALVPDLTAALPEQVTESVVAAQLAVLQRAVEAVEREGLTPRTARTEVTQEAHDKKVQALDDFFTPNKAGGYRSFKEAFVDFTGRAPKAFDEDFNRTILRESLGMTGSYDSARASEGLDTTSWAQILGDSVTRRMVAEYARPNLQTWRMIVSSTPSVNDFRDQKIDRMGGYGTLPTVAQGAAYTALTSPTDEEATYALTKRGGTEAITFEMIANDDVRAISRIPVKLGLAAAQTLYRFVWGMLPANAATSYDAVALFHASHANTDVSSPLSQSTLAVARRKMGVQAAYGDASDVLSIEPAFLVVPASLEEQAYKLCTSAVAVPASGESSDMPNINQGLTPIKVPYWTDQDDWFLIADPGLCPTIEVGFYQGQQEPSLFTQADPSVGSVWDTDKMQLKIRHIYSGTVLEHRGMYRGVGGAS
jgi:hypothetical protein